MIYTARHPIGTVAIWLAYHGKPQDFTRIELAIHSWQMDQLKRLIRARLAEEDDD